MAQKRSIVIRKKKPLVVFADREDHPLDHEIKHRIARAARAHDWELLDVDFMFERIPHDRKPSGALIRDLPTDPLAQHLGKIGFLP